MLQRFRSVAYTLGATALCIGLASTSSYAYQKPGAPVSLATTAVEAGDNTQFQAELRFDQTGTATVTSTATPSHVTVISNTFSGTISHPGETLSVPITLNHSLNDVEYVNLFVTFLAQNGATSHRALSIKVKDSNGASNLSKSQLVPSDQPIYMQAKETISQ